MNNFTMSEWDDINYLMNKIINDEEFYAPEIIKARYLSKRIKEFVVDMEDVQ